MTKAARQLLSEFDALPKKAQKEVLVGLLRLPIDAHYAPPDNEQLRHAADALFQDFDRREAEA
jgi:hypothetical protein